MIASFFRRLEATAVEYLLISGQATILYGAATFSEDVDLWVQPSPLNLARFVDVLRASGARYYKLTPPFTVENLERGHGFHFVLPSEPPDPDVYLDVMGRPPRVESFEAAVKNARHFETDFGRVHTVGIKDLVELKKTQRPSDYPIIGRLALALLEDPATPERELEIPWALDNTFSLLELRGLLQACSDVLPSLLPALPGPLARAATEFGVAQELSPALEDELDAWFEAKSSVLRRADRRYWRAIIDELRELRRARALMPEGAPV